MRFEAYKIS